MRQEVSGTSHVTPYYIYLHFKRYLLYIDLQNTCNLHNIKSSRFWSIKIPYYVTDQHLGGQISCKINIFALIMRNKI